MTSSGLTMVRWDRPCVVDKDDEFQSETGRIGLHVLSEQVSLARRSPPESLVILTSDRKRRCDARKPACSNCVELEVECHYDDLPSQRYYPISALCR